MGGCCRYMPICRDSRRCPTWLIDLLPTTATCFIGSRECCGAHGWSRRRTRWCRGFSAGARPGLFRRVCIFWFSNNGADRVKRAAPRWQAFLATQREFFGVTAIYNAPTLFWLNSSDLALQILPLIGALLAFLLMLGLTRRIIYIALFVLYLSLVTAGQDFMGFQWDSLLLEAGLLAIFLDTPSNLIVWLYRCLLFRLMFLSGYAKIASGDETWRNLTALDYHFWTQPIPNVIAYYVAQFPEGILRGMTFGMFVIEVVVPFFIFAPRRLRAVAGILLVGFQLLLVATGNFAFFNLLALALCLFCFDDQFLRRIIPPQWAERISRAICSSQTIVVGTAGGASPYHPCAAGEWSAAARSDDAPCAG